MDSTSSDVYVCVSPGLVEMRVRYSDWLPDVYREMWTLWMWLLVTSSLMAWHNPTLLHVLLT